MTTYALRIGEYENDNGNHVVEYYWSKAKIEERIKEIKEIFPKICLFRYNLSEENISLDRGVWEDGQGRIESKTGKFTYFELLKYVFRI